MGIGNGTPAQENFNSNAITVIYECYASGHWTERVPRSHLRAALCFGLFFLSIGTRFQGWERMAELFVPVVGISAEPFRYCSDPCSGWWLLSTFSVHLGGPLEASNLCGFCFVPPSVLYHSGLRSYRLFRTRLFCSCLFLGLPPWRHCLFRLSKERRSNSTLHRVNVVRNKGRCLFLPDLSPHQIWVACSEVLISRLTGSIVGNRDARTSHHGWCISERYTGAIAP